MDINYLSDEEIVNEQNSNNKNNENYDNIYDEMYNDEMYNDEMYNDEEYNDECDDDEYNKEKNEYFEQQQILILNALQKKQNYILNEETLTPTIKKNTQVNKNMNITELNIHIDEIIKKSTPAKFISSRFLQKKQDSNNSNSNDNIIRNEIKRTFNPRLPPFFQKKYNN
jgi:hypothetical protein